MIIDKDLFILAKNNVDYCIKLEQQIEKLQQELIKKDQIIEKAETVLRCIKELDILGKDNQSKMAYVARQYFQDKQKDEVKNGQS